MLSNRKDEFIHQLQRPLRIKELQDAAKQLLQDTRYQSVERFITTLEEDGIIKKYYVAAKNGKQIPVYCSIPLSEVDVYQLATSIYPNGYFNHFSAVYYHSLTNQVPNTVYWCREWLTTQADRGTEVLPEARIRSAFIKPHRHTNLVFKHNTHDIVITSALHRTDYGVEKIESCHSPCPRGFRITGLERTLINAVASPQYNGGLSSICTYFQAASDKLDIDKMIDIYRNLNFIYPYAQSLGFFMAQCGMKDHAEKLRKAYPPQQRFYVDHGAKSTWLYNEYWMLFHPKGLGHEY